MKIGETVRILSQEAGQPIMMLRVKMLLPKRKILAEGIENFDAKVEFDADKLFYLGSLAVIPITEVSLSRY